MQEVPGAAAEGQAVGWILGIGLSRNLLSTEVVGVMPQESSFSITSPFVSLAAKSWAIGFVDCGAVAVVLGKHQLADLLCG